MDEAELWLRENDPAYERMAESWKHIRTGEYVMPKQEIPWGGTDDLDLLVEVGGYYYVDELERATAKGCRCGRSFFPRVPWQQFCSERCRKRAWERTSPPRPSRAAYMREYRRRAA